MAYDAVNNPIKCLVEIPGSDGLRLWAYKDGDAIATVDNTDYFTDAGQLGVQEGDFVLISDTTNTRGSIAVVTDVDSDNNVTIDGLTAVP